MVLTMTGAGAEFKLGADVLLQHYTYLMKGQRVGLITNQTGRNAAGQATIDLLYRHPQIKLVALFSPEHGIRGEAAAGVHVQDSRDNATGLPVYSLYGAQGHRPTDEQLTQVDTLVYDIQDVGSRAYTYIWTMAECMQAAGQAGKTFIVLDRPNPHGGAVIDGPTVDPQWKSFLGLYPIPRVYGMTPGELARLFNGVYQLNVRLVVVPMQGYRRTMSWAETGLRWVPSSPNIPTPESAVGFAATGTIGTLGFIHIGIGTTTPFQVIGAGWINPQASADELNRRGLPGVLFVPYTFIDRRGEQVPSVFLKVTDPTRFFPTTTEVVILEHLQRAYPGKFQWPEKAFNCFDKAMGTSSVREGLQSGQPLNQLLQQWQTRQETFKRQRRAYLIYP